MNVFKINGKTYNVLVTELSENFNILYSENTGRTISSGARMSLDPLGTFIGHKITFQKKSGFEKDYDDLFDYLCKPRYSGVMLECVHGQDKISYEAYVSNGERSLKKVDGRTGKISWGALSVNFVPMEAQITG